MAYTKSPENSTYQTKEMDFTDASWYRSGSTSVRRDAEIVNMYFERNTNENQTRSMALIKRPGMEDSSIDLGKTAASSVINGYFQDPSERYLYWSVNNKVYSLDLSTLVRTQIATITGTSTGFVNSVGFCGFLTSAGVRYICFNNGSELWYHVVGSGTSTQVTDAQYPAATYPTIVFLDGYLFVINKDTGDIYNSDLDNPASWTAGNYITAEISPDLACALAKVKNYLVCFGREGIEFFYDAANLSGSPLGRNESFYKAVGLVSNVTSIGDTLFFTGKAKNQGPRVYKLEGDSLSPISNTWVDRYLLQISSTALNSDGNALLQGFSISLNGSHFYLLNHPTYDLVLVYDLDTKFWYRWDFVDAGSIFPHIQAVWAVNDILSNYPYIAMGNQSLLSYMSNTNYQDYAANFTASYTTTDFTADTFNWKTCSRVGLFCDFPTTAVATSNAQISWSDDDGNSFSTARNLNVCSSNPYITQCGRFRSRNWRIEYADNYPFRMWGLSIDINIGNV